MSYYRPRPHLGRSITAKGCKRNFCAPRAGSSRCRRRRTSRANTVPEIAAAWHNSRLTRKRPDMYQVLSEQHRNIVSAILRSPVRPPKFMRGLDWRRFLQTFFANVDSKDLAERDPKDLAGAALSHLMFAMRRRRTALVRVFNPTLREHGFVSPHTIIDVVNDDMPFLVDSISLALTERALTLHFLAHPIFEVTRDRGGNLSALQERGESKTAKQRLESFQHVGGTRIAD